MSTLLIRCPLKPFTGALTGLAGEWEDLACAQRFEWCLVSNADAVNAPTTTKSTSISISTSTSTLIPPMQSGIGDIDSMPYADEALVLLPTLDVRLIETKVPLANPKKLQAILPTLIEEYVLSNTASLHIDLLPPIPGQPAMDRTLTAIDRAWFTWITAQLEQLLTHRVRFIPDCLLLALPGDALARDIESDLAGDLVSDLVSASKPVLMSVHQGDAIVYCQRTGMQTGIAWAEICTPSAEQQGNANQESAISSIARLPSCLGSIEAVAFSWAWAAPSAMAFLAANASSRAPNFALNLLPAGFKRRAGVRMPLDSSADRDSATATALAWVDPITWQPALRWLGVGIAAISIGFIAQLVWLSASNWRWGQQMELLALPSLTPASITKLSNSAQDRGVLRVFLEQTIATQRSQGAVTDADFAPLAAKLQKLRSALNAQSLQQINYSPNAIEFEFKAGAVDYSSTDGALRVIASARNLGLDVKHLGSNRYRLEAYAGLGALP